MNPMIPKGLRNPMHHIKRIIPMNPMSPMGSTKLMNALKPMNL